MKKLSYYLSILKNSKNNRKINSIKEIIILILLFILGMYSHTIKIYIVKWSGNPILTHNIFLVYLLIFFLILSNILEEYRPLNRKYLVFHFKYKLYTFRKFGLPEIIENKNKIKKRIKKTIKSFLMKYW